MLVPPASNPKKSHLRLVLRSTTLVLLVTIAVLLATACDSSSEPLELEIDQLTLQIDQEKTTSQQLSAEKQSLSNKIDELQDKLSKLESQAKGRAKDISVLENRIRELSDTLERSISIQGLNDLAIQLEADRLLLLDFRKESPRDETEAEIYWQQVKLLAVRSDPSLGPKIDRVTRAMPNYFKFLDQKFTSAIEAQLAYQLLGDAYETAADEFWDAFMATLSGRLDLLVRLTTK